MFCATEKAVDTLLSSGQEGTNDGAKETCSFTEVHGICSLENTLFVSQLVSGLCGTVSFLLALGSLYI